MLSRVVENTFCCNLNNRNILREVIIKIGLERIDIQKGITVEVLLDSRATGLVISLEFIRKQGFKLKKIENSIYVRNVDEIFNKEELIKKYCRSKYLLLEIQGKNGDRCNWRTKVECNFRNAIACLLQS